MKVNSGLVALLFVLLLTGVLSAQKAKPVRFTSVYSSPGKGCKVLRGGPPGTDEGSLCKGPGGYWVRVYYSAVATHIAAEIKGQAAAYTLAMLDMGFEESKARLEWRLANGKPFAVIMRVPTYGPVTETDPYFGPVIGQELIVRGLRGFEDLESSVSTKTPGANAEARRLADAGYSERK